MKNESGRSMIEMLGVLAIIGVLSVGGIAGYSKAMQQIKINKTIEQISQIASNIRTTFASQKNYTGLYNVRQLIAPEEMRKHNGVYTVFGAELYIGENSDKTSFQIGFDDDLPMDICVKIAMYDWRAAGATIIGIYNADDDIFYFLELPTSPTDVIKACNSPENGSRVAEIVFEANPEDEYWKDKLERCNIETSHC